MTLKLSLLFKKLKRYLTSKKRRYHTLRIIKFTFISLFIILSIWIMVSANIGLDLPQIFPTKYSPDDPDQIISRINWNIRYADWMIDHIGFGMGLKNYWRMFAPVDRFNWYMKFIAIHENGDEKLLPLASQMDRNVWERNFVDFREAKFHLNIYSNKRGQEFYARYLCRKHSDSRNPITSIRIDLDSKNILSPEKAKELGTTLDPVMQTKVWGNFSCNS